MYGGVMVFLLVRHRGTHLEQRPSLDLADAFAGQSHDVADLLESVGSARFGRYEHAVQVARLTDPVLAPAVRAGR